MIGAQFRAKREAMGLTQKEVAELFGCSTDDLILGEKSAQKLPPAEWPGASRTGRAA